MAASAVVAALAQPAAPAIGQRPEKVERLEIVERAIAFHGGELFAGSETEYEICSQSGCFEVRSRVEGGLFDHEVTGRVKNRTQRVRTTNDRVEWWRDGEQHEVEPFREQALRNWVMERVYFAFLPYRLDDPSVWKQDLGHETWGGRALHKVKVTFDPGSSTDSSDEFLYWFDPETGRLEQFAYSYHRDPGGVRFRRLSNFRRVEGILFYDQENFGKDEPGLAVESVTPASAGDLEKVSTVELKNIRVRLL
jgi:hypothetical protein